MAKKYEELSTSNEDYLERIYELIEDKGYARVSDIAASLSLSRPSVSAMVQRLAKGGFLSYEKYRGLTLTEKGKKIALRVKYRHIILAEFLTHLNLDLDTVLKDVEGMEHHISPDTLQKIETLVRYWRKHPEQIKKILAS
ncbi:MAG: transcriptional regulator MntR [Verrucomicrobiota bacterium]|nr:transcriptional regulator MntR [Verrucomicrobiota bacterium]